MRRNSFAAIAFSLSAVLFSLSHGASAQTVSSPARSVSEITPLERDLRRHIEYLASDKLEGRRTGEPGAALAMEYVASQFKALKLRSPGGLRSGTFAQEFPYVTGVETGAGNEFKLYYIDSGSTSTEGIRPVAFSPNGEITATGTSVVYAGFGIVSPEQGRDDYAGLDAKGKIVLVLDGNPDNDNPHSPLGRFDVRTKALIARDKGAAAMLVISREADTANDRLSSSKFDQTLGEAAVPTFIFPRRKAAEMLLIDEAALASLESGKTKRENSGTIATASFRVNLAKKTTPAYNVVGVLPGTDPVLKNEAIVVGAHYDHLGRGGQGSLDVNSTEVHHGADDNASGTAAVIELARRFATEHKNKRTIIFIAFSGEEEGLLGSQFYLNHPLFPLEKTVAMINLDMIGRLSGEKLNVGGMGTAAEWPALVDEKNKVALTVIGGMGKDQRSYKAAAPQFKLQLSDDGFGPSDHSSFYGKKIPVLFFFTGTHNDYHKPSDTADKINYNGETRIVNYISEIVRTVDRNPARPTYTVAKSTGISGGRSGFNISLGTVPNYADSTDGLLLDGVRDNSPAAKAGIMAGDKIVRLAGKDIRNVMDYTYVLGEMKAGTEYEIVVVRGGERLALKIIPVKR